MNSPPASLEAPNPIARIIPREAHTISRSHISPNALRVLYRLNDAGFQGFLVGGCVRDLMLGLTPKDFDVATDALPEQVKRLFRNCRLVGRRFRLAHVFFGRETIEVATFRASSAPSVAEEPPLDDAEDLEDTGAAAEFADNDDETVPAPGMDDPRAERLLDEHGRILRDNMYGSIDEDVWRRDFTANSLYYNIADFSVWDYVDGAEDIAARRLRLIGDPETRYREDPVRMLRAVRFEAKLGFTIDGPSAAPIPQLRGLLAGVPPPRLFDETLKLFLTGHGRSSFAALRRHALLSELMPNVADYFDRHPNGRIAQLVERGLADTDARVEADKPVSPTFLFAVLLYGPIAATIEALPPQRWHEPGAILDACDQAMRALLRRIAVPRRFSLGVREMYALQPRLEAPRGRRALRLLEHPRFRAAYDLLALRAQFGMARPEIFDWWTKLQAATPQERATMADAIAAQGGSRGEGGAAAPRRRRRRRRGGGGAPRAP